jgi:hypothetical protein
MPWILFALGLIPAIFIFSKALDLGFFADDFVLLQWLHQQSALNFLKAFTSSVNDTRSRPVVALFWLMDKGLGIGSGRSCHVTNILIHALNVALLIHWIRILTRNIHAALLAGLLFLYHPIQPEAVFWVTGRVDPICCLFMLLALICYTRDIRAPSRAGRHAIFILGLLACFSKETGLIFLGLALALELGLASETAKPDIKKYLFAYRPALGRLAALSLLLAAYICLRIFFTRSLVPEVVAKELKKADLFSRLAIAAYHTLRPVWNSPDEARSLGTAFIMVPIAAILLAIYRVPRMRDLLIALALFILSLVPAMGSTFEWNSYTGSRFLYIPAAGLSMTLAILMLGARNPDLKSKAAGWLLGIVLAIFYMVQLNRNILPFQEARTTVTRVVLGLSSSCRPGACRPQMYVMDLPRDKKGVMIFSRDIALTDAVKLSLGKKINFRGQNLPPGPALPGAELGAVQAFHSGRVSSGENVLNFPGSEDLLTGKAAVYRWNKQTDELIDLTEPVMKAVAERNKLLADNPVSLKPISLVENADWRGLVIKKQLYYDNSKKSFLVTGSDPYFESASLSIDPLLVDKVVIAMSFSSAAHKASAQLFWRDSSSPFSERSSVIFPIETDGKVHQYSIDLNANPNFILCDRIIQLRFDPADNAGILKLESVSILPINRK